MDVLLFRAKFEKEFLHVLAILFSLFDVCIGLSGFAGAWVVHPDGIEISLTEQNHDDLARAEVGKRKLFLQRVGYSHFSVLNLRLLNRSKLEYLYSNILTYFNIAN